MYSSREYDVGRGTNSTKKEEMKDEVLERDRLQQELAQLQQENRDFKKRFIDIQMKLKAPQQQRTYNINSLFFGPNALIDQKEGPPRERIVNGDNMSEEDLRDLLIHNTQFQDIFRTIGKQLKIDEEYDEDDEEEEEFIDEKDLYGSSSSDSNQEMQPPIKKVEPNVVKAQPAAPQPSLATQLQQLQQSLTMEQVVVNLSHPSILHIDSAYQESRRTKWREWLPTVYGKDFSTYVASKKELYIQIELNRLLYTVGGNIRQLLPPQPPQYTQLNNHSYSPSELCSMLSDLMLYSPEVQFHKSSIKVLQIELMSYRFEGTITERRVIIACIMRMCQQMRISVYYRIQKLVNKVVIGKRCLYYIQPETQQDHLALSSSLNINEKIIQKQEESKIQKRKAKIGLTVAAMFQLFIQKVQKLLDMGIYQRAFRLPCFNGGRAEVQRQNQVHLEHLKGFFFIHVLNDPIIRSFKVQDPSIEKEWMCYLESGKLVEFTTMLFENN